MDLLLHEGGEGLGELLLVDVLDTDGRHLEAQTAKQRRYKG